MDFLKKNLHAQKMISFNSNIASHEKKKNDCSICLFYIFLLLKMHGNLRHN